MKIAIDCRNLTGKPTGTASYLISAINELSIQNPTWTLHLLINREMDPEAKNRLYRNSNIIIVKKPFIFFKKIGVIWYVFKVYFILKDLKSDFFWAPGQILPPVVPKNIKTIVTVLDLVAKKHKKTMSLINRIYNDIFLSKSINSADILWAISNYTKNEIENYYPRRKCKNIIVGSGVDRAIYKKNEITPTIKKGILKKLNCNEKFILFVGTIEPRKNLKLLLSLMPDLAYHGFSLLIVGGKGWGKTGIKEILDSKYFPKNKVTFSGFLPTKELIQIYNIASVYVSPSLNEGFGLPQLEAMNCGCPVVTAHNSAMIEVVEGAGITVKGWDKKEWVAKINHAYLNRDKYIKLGLQRSREFDWKKIINKLSNRCVESMSPK